MRRAQKVGHALRGHEVRTVRETDGEGMQLGKILRFARDVALTNGRHETRIEPAGEQDAPGHIRHHPTCYGLFEGIA